MISPEQKGGSHASMVEAVEKESGNQSSAEFKFKDAVPRLGRTLLSGMPPFLLSSLSCRRGDSQPIQEKPGTTCESPALHHDIF